MYLYRRQHWEMFIVRILMPATCFTSFTSSMLLLLAPISFYFWKLPNLHHSIPPPTMSPIDTNQCQRSKKQELRMLSLSLFIQGSLWMLRLLFSIVWNVISVSNVSRIALLGCSLNVIVIVIVIVTVIVKVYFGQVMSPHHCDHMSKGSQVSQIALWFCFSWSQSV